MATKISSSEETFISINWYVGEKYDIELSLKNLRNPTFPEAVFVLQLITLSPLSSSWYY